MRYKYNNKLYKVKIIKTYTTNCGVEVHDIYIPELEIKLWGIFKLELITD
tara:strand:+ start:1738 stop:1887 length:150 start_codon:yes stop_codon:yes gene_type:complete